MNVRPMHCNDRGVDYHDGPVRVLPGHDPRITVAECAACAAVTTVTVDSDNKGGTLTTMNALTATGANGTDTDRALTLTEWRVGDKVERVGPLAEVILHGDGVLTFTVRGWRLHVGPEGNLVVIGAGDGDVLNVERTMLPDFAGGGDRLVVTK